MHLTALIAEDHGQAAAIVQYPAVDGPLSALVVLFWRSLPLTFLALLGFVGS
jgi:hypothetical protein